MKLSASPESSTPPEPCLDIGTIITPTKSISDICHTVGNLSNAEKISLLLQHVPPPAVLPTTFSHGCNRKFNVSWLTKYPWLRYSPKLDAVLCGPCTLLLREDSRKDKGWLVNRPFSNCMGVASNEAEEAGASSLFCVRTHARIGDVL